MTSLESVDRYVSSRLISKVPLKEERPILAPKIAEIAHKLHEPVRQVAFSDATSQFFNDSLYEPHHMPRQADMRHAPPIQEVKTHIQDE